jgi:hypothetical protein
MVSEKLLQDLIFTKKLVANTRKWQQRNKAGSEAHDMLTKQLERLENTITELEFAVDIAAYASKIPAKKKGKK